VTARVLAAVFPSHAAAAKGVRYLEQVGFEPWRIEVVEDPRRAVEIAVRRYTLNYRQSKASSRRSP
jgi:hypothetical protein